MKPLILILLCAGSFYAGLQVRQPPTVETRWQTIYQPAFVPIKSHSRYYGEQLAKIEAAIPETALRRK